MSFSADVKSELCTVRPTGSTADAECYGMLFMCRSLSFDKILLQTASKQTAERFSLLLRRCFDVIAEVKSGGERRTVYRVSVGGGSDRKKILFHYGCKGGGERRINRELLKTEGSVGAFLRGAFLAGGSLCDPEKEYRADFSFKDRPSAEQFRELLTGKQLPSGLAERNGRFAVYIKDSAVIEDLLTVMGAGNETLNLIGVKIYKSLRNKSNRINNCETSNILKTADAAFAQTKAIRKLEKAGRLETLPEELYEVAVLRLENPELSLSALCRLSKEKLTRSGFNHRMSKLMELANEER